MHLAKGQLTFTDGRVVACTGTNMFDRRFMTAWLEQYPDVKYDQISHIYVRDIVVDFINEMPASLQSLTIHHSTVKGIAIPPRCAALTYIDVNNANLVYQPRLTHCARLRVLNIQNTRIAMLGELPPMLDEMQLMNNQLTNTGTFPSIFNRRRKIRTVRLDYNLIDTAAITPFIRANVHIGPQKGTAFGSRNRAGNAANFRQSAASAFAHKTVTEEMIVQNQVREDLRAGFDHLATVKAKKNMFDDDQTVHISSINVSTNKSIKRIFELAAQQPEISQLMAINGFTLAIFKNNRALIPKFVEMIKDQTEHVIFNITYAQLVATIWRLIRFHPSCGDIVDRLRIEICESFDVCFSGRILRLVNALCGFFGDDVAVGISTKEQIGNQMGQLIEQLTTNKMDYAAVKAAMEEIVRNISDTDDITPEYARSWLIALEDYAPETV